MRYYLKLCLTFVICFLLTLTLTGSVWAGRKDVRLLLKVKRLNHHKVEQNIREHAGRVHHKYQFIDAMAVTVPLAAIDDVLGKPEVLDAFKDLEIRITKPPSLKRNGFLAGDPEISLNAIESAAIENSSDMTSLFAASDNLDPFTTSLIRSRDLFLTEGLTGSGVIVGIMDSGLRDNLIAISPRIIGGENFVPLVPELDDGLPAIHPNNDNHGSNVACCVGAAAVFGFNANDVVAAAIARYAANSVIPDLFGAGTVGVPMIGAAPGCSFFALKVFNRFGRTSNSIILAAMERVIELKEKYDKGKAGGVNLQVVNISFGSETLNSGNDPFFAELVEQMTRRGIVAVVSAGNTGPSGMTGGDPGLAENIITVGASNDAAHERILREVQFRQFFGAGVGGLWRPLDNHLTAFFSSRGPTPDGRSDPELVAPGFARFCQGSPGGSDVVFATGSSFAAPTVAGVAALLLEAVPNARPDEIRAALLAGANPNLLETAGSFDQGFGFVDAAAALQQLRSKSKNPRDKGRRKPSVRKNIQKLVGSKNIISAKPFTTSITLAPGEREEFFVEIDPKTQELMIAITNIVQKDPVGNPLFGGDDLTVAVHSAKTSRIGSFGDYLFGPAFVFDDLFLNYPAEVLDFGLARVTIMGSAENVGKVSAVVRIEKLKSKFEPGERVGLGRLRQGDIQSFKLNVPPGARQADFILDWNKHWGEYPTNDLDMIIQDPNGQIFSDGVSLDIPERVSIFDPAPGEWLIDVVGLTIWQKPDDSFRLYASLDLAGLKLAGEAELTDLNGDAAEIRLIPTEFSISQNYPNPFNPETEIKYGLPQAAQVKLNIYNIRGQLVRTLVDEQLPAGFYTARWDGKDATGSAVASGTYFYRIAAGDFVKTFRMTFLK